MVTYIKNYNMIFVTAIVMYVQPLSKENICIELNNKYAGVQNNAKQSANYLNLELG